MLEGVLDSNTKDFKNVSLFMMRNSTLREREPLTSKSVLGRPSYVPEIIEECSENTKKTDHTTVAA